MAYKTEDLKKQALEAIKEHGLFFIEDVVAYIPCDKTTFYRHFPTESNGYNDIKELLEQNSIKVKVSMRSKWYKSDNPTLQMGLMKLLSSDTELRKLSMEHRDHTSGGDRIQGSPIIISEPKGERPERK